MGVSGYWYWLTWVVPDKEPLNGCVCVCPCNTLTLTSLTRQFRSLTSLPAENCAYDKQLQQEPIQQPFIQDNLSELVLVKQSSTVLVII